MKEVGLVVGLVVVLVAIYIQARLWIEFLWR